MSSQDPTVVTGTASLRFPLTVLSIDAEAGGAVHKFQPVFTFRYTGTALESQEDGTDKQVPRIFVESFDSPIEGRALEWYIQAGDTIRTARDPLFAVLEPCVHQVQYRGMCANCGKDLTAGDFLGLDETGRATVAMSHDDLGLTVSHSEAARLERETTRRLVQTSRLSLIVDLDQCVIQTTVDPTVGEWLADGENPNKEALADVQHFRIAEEGPHAPIYYVKPRPGLKAFFERVTRRYEMHIYTMGTRPYALKIASIIDPEGIFFGSRILSRDENGSHTQKSVGRLFPVDTNMVVIMDDRGDVWQWCPNLIKVQPFEFFLGTGDINSSFLAPLEEKQALVPATTPATASMPAPSNIENAPVEDAAIREAQAHAQQATLDAQIEARPLAHLQEADPALARNRPTLTNNDNTLTFVEKTLREVHARFYQLYNEHMAEVSKDRTLANLKTGQRSRKRHAASSASHADVKLILPALKRQVLQDVVISFSGLMSEQRDPRQAWQGKLAVDFGARVLDARSKGQPTHVIVGDQINLRNLTEKAKMPKQYPWIKVVYVGWLVESTKQFQRLPEKQWQLDPDASDVPVPEEELDAMRGSGGGGQASEAESLETDDGATDRLIDERARQMDWGDLEGEMADFLGDLSDGTTASGDESDASVGSRFSSSSSPRKSAPSAGDKLKTPTKQGGRQQHHKRQRSEQVSDMSADELLLRSPLSKRKKVAQMRKSGLARSIMPTEGQSSPERGDRAASTEKNFQMEEEQAEQEAGNASAESDSESLLDFAAELEQGLA